VADKLASYGPAIKQVVARTKHRQHKGLNYAVICRSVGAIRRQWRGEHSSAAGSLPVRE
jgi:transposase-like protein